jgi:adenosylcobinamide-phosphate synthase
MVLRSLFVATIPLLAGAALDAVVGDPRGWPHPVRAIGALIRLAERLARRLLARVGNRPRVVRAAGAALAVIVVALTCLATGLFLNVLARLGTIAALVGETLLVYWGLAARSLGREVFLASEAPDLSTARRELAMIVGRDSANLERPEIHRACLETVGENASDGIIAPLFWYALGGPSAMWGYKAINTLDSMNGYRNDRYRDLGWASARLDDLACLIPARLTWLLFVFAAALRRERPLAALRIGWRDGRKHTSPNSAWGEAALAGALGVQLGGDASYGGVPGSKPLLGEPHAPIDANTVRRGVYLMWIAALIALVLAWAARVALQWAKG